MNKKFVLPLALFALATIATSCDMKRCYCYETTNSGVIETETYVLADEACNSNNTSLQTCVENNERMDPDDIAWK